ncbi:uncharacterized protein LOC129612824 [Condylostylus longicornis]|uniref:uncharacterized protein LOC129612824 n=1 Tax=Condylostylus longicornis TaxID=2530218 RepID=UPI00244E0215|nr:uncharacterized protein LOC129612824 [Condylostylus longicornis]XP_055382584.1 uncharacterized protein LOC129612824 [Condylostylus longicornis]
MQERRVKKLKGGHYVATHGRFTPDPPYVHSNRGYSTDGEESHRAPSERTLSEYTVANERMSPGNYRHTSSRKHTSSRTGGGGGGGGGGGSMVNGGLYSNGGPKHLGPMSSSNHHINGIRLPSRAPSALSYDHGGDNGSDIYVTSAAYKEPSELSRYSGHRAQSRSGARSIYSVASSAKTGRSGRSHRKRGAKIEAMSAPNPFCPNIRGVCCLMLLLNLGLILVTLGFVIVIQFFEPTFVWILGIIFLVFGFLTLIGSMIYCVYVCRDAKTPSQLRNEDLYWTRHWQKNIGYTPQEINYKVDKYDNYSDRYSVSKMSVRESNHNRY